MATSAMIDVEVPVPIFQIKHESFGGDSVVVVENGFSVVELGFSVVELGSIVVELGSSVVELVGVTVVVPCLWRL